MQYSLLFPMVIANMTATGCSLLLLRRGPSRRLRLLTLDVGLMTLAQNSYVLFANGIWTGGSFYTQHLHHLLVTALSLLAIYILRMEACDRNYTDRKLRLLEHELAQQAQQALLPEPKPAPAARRLPAATPSPAIPRFYAGAARRRVVDISTVPHSCTTDILGLVSATGESVQPASQPSPKEATDNMRAG